MLPQLKITDFYAFTASSPLWQQIIWTQYESLISLKESIFSKTKVEGERFKHMPYHAPG